MKLHNTLIVAFVALLCSLLLTNAIRLQTMQKGLSKGMAKGSQGFAQGWAQQGSPVVGTRPIHHHPTQPINPNQPIYQPTQPINTNQPIYQPNQPISQPHQPINQPIYQPNQPINQPINQPTHQPNQPINQPINQPTQPINQPIHEPVNQPINENTDSNIINRNNQPNQPINQPNQPINQPNQPINQPNQPGRPNINNRPANPCPAGELLIPGTRECYDPTREVLHGNLRCPIKFPNICGQQCYDANLSTCNNGVVTPI